MNNLNKNNELEIFIDDKKLNTKLEDEIIFNYYAKIIHSCIEKIYKKFKNLEYLFSALETIQNIYIIIINYSNNIKLSMFLSERAIILYQEYIELSININEEVNLKTIKIFVYKKSIGNIISNENNISYDISNLCILYKKFLYLIINSNITNINNLLSIRDNYKEIFFQYLTFYQLDFLEDLLYSNNLNIQEINCILYKINMYSYLLDNSLNQDNILTILIEKFNKDKDKINDLKDIEINIYEKDFYIESLQELNIY